MTGLAIVIAVVCAIVLAIAAGARRTMTAPDRYTAALGGERDALVTQLDSGVPQTAAIRKLAAVESADGYTFLFGGLARPGTTDGYDALLFAGSPAANGLRLTSGRLVDSASTTEFVATTNFVEQAGAVVGDRFDLLTYTQEEAGAGAFGVRPPTNPPRAAVLVGTVDGARFDDSTPLVFFAPALIEPPTFGISQTEIAVSLWNGFDLTDLRDELDLVVDGGKSMKVEKSRVVSDPARRAVDAQAQGLWLVALVSGVAAVAVLGQLVTRHVRLGAPDRAPLAAIGFAPRQFFVESLVRAAVPILAGTVVGGALAIVPSGIFPGGFVRRLEPEPGIAADWAILIAGVAVLLVGVLAWTAAALALDQRPTRAVRPSRTVETISTRGASASAAAGLRFAFTRRTGERGSASSAIAGLALVIGGLVAATVFGVSLRVLVASPDRFGSNYDLALGDNGGDSLDPSLLAAVQSDPDVTAITLYAYGAARVGERTVDLVGMQSIQGDLAPKVTNGRLPATDDEIALGLVTAKALGVSTGDSVPMAGASATVDMRVTGIAIVSGFGPIEGMGEGGVVTFAGMTKLDDSSAITTAALNLVDRDPDTIARLATVTGLPLGEQPSGSYRPAAITNVARVRSTPFVLATLLAGLAVLSVVHIMMTSLRKRRRDFAILAAVGADRGWIRRVIHWQASTFTILPVAFGIPIGVVAGRAAFVAFADSMGAGHQVTVAPLLLGATALALLALANAAATPSWPRRSTRVADSLRAD